jgi:DNA-binding CsgD family transcriptional regulator
VSYKTVVNTCWQLRQKLAVKNLQDLVRTAVRLLAVN